MMDLPMLMMAERALKESALSDPQTWGHWSTGVPPRIVCYKEERPLLSVAIMNDSHEGLMMTLRAITMGTACDWVALAVDVDYTVEGEEGEKQDAMMLILGDRSLTVKAGFQPYRVQGRSVEWGEPDMSECVTGLKPRDMPLMEHVWEAMAAPTNLDGARANLPEEVESRSEEEVEMLLLLTTMVFLDKEQNTIKGFIRPEHTMIATEILALLGKETAVRVAKMLAVL